jgi:integrase
MSIFKRGGVYWYEFVFNGKRVQASTHQGNQRVAREIEAAHRTALARGEAGIVKRKAPSTFRELAQRFLAHVEARHENKPQTVAFYAAKLNRLMKFPAIASARVDSIDEGAIEKYVIFRRESVGPATVNRELATLRRILRLAQEWKEIDRVPRIRLLGGERIRDFVLSRAQEKIYLDACPQPLKDIAALMLETGLRIGETLALEWPDVALEPLSGSRFGYIRIREGKSKNARRTLPLTDRAGEMLAARRVSRVSSLVFANGQGKQYLGTSINHLHREVAAPKIDGKRRPIFDADFVMHSLRHTMLTRLGESGVDAFTIMRIAGHSSVVVSQRYVHPTPEAVERAFERLQLHASGNAALEASRLGVPTIVPTVGKAVAVSH